MNNDPEARRAYMREWRAKNKDRINAENRIKRKAKRAMRGLPTKFVLRADLKSA